MILLPFPDFQSSARCLDNATLGRMRFEILKLASVLLFDDNYIEYEIEWKMWQNSEYALISYGFELCNEWKLRGNIDTVYPRLADYLQLVKFSLPPDPKWISNEAILDSHKAALLKFDFSWYSRYFEVENYKEMNLLWP